MRSSLWTLLALSCVAAGLRGETVQDSAPIWYSIGVDNGPANRLEASLRGLIQRNSRYTIDDGDPSEWQGTVPALLRREPRRLVFIYCALRECRGKLIDPEWQSLGVKMLNPRVASLPLYVFQRGDFVTAAQPRDTVRIGYYAPANIVVQNADVEALIGSLYRNVPRIRNAKLVPQPEPNGRLLAEKFSRRYAEGYELVAIYDEEPSIALTRFLERVESDTVAVLPVQGPISPSQANLEYRLLTFGEQKFYRQGVFASLPDSAGIVVIARPDTLGADMLPVVLSNVGRLSPDLAARIDSTLGDYYIRAVEPLLVKSSIDERVGYGSLTAGTPESKVFSRTLLLNAHLADATNPYKALSLYSHYKINKFAEDPRAYATMAKLTERHLRALSGVDSLDSWSIKELLDSLRVELDAPSPTPRGAYSGCAEDEFAEARVLIDLAGNLVGPVGLDSLRAARDRLFKAVALWDDVGRPQRCSGVWYTKNYDPYYLLALVDVQIRTVAVAQ